MSQPDLVAEKAALRREAIALRDAKPAAGRAAAAQAIAARPLPVSPPRGAFVSGYSALKSEIDPLPLMRRFAEAGAGLALPVVVAKGQPLVMRAWAIGEPLESGVWGIREPQSKAPEVFPDILIVPLLAFDRRGRRLGYGGGFYDRTITRLRAMKPVVTIGLAFAAQELPAVPVTPSDATLDFVLTERETIDCRAG